MVASAKLFTPALPPGVERKGRKVSNESGGMIINALLPADLVSGLKRIAQKRGVTFSALLRDVITSNQQLMREIEDSRPVRKAR